MRPHIQDSMWLHTWEQICFLNQSFDCSNTSGKKRVFLKRIPMIEGNEQRTDLLQKKKKSTLHQPYLTAICILALNQGLVPNLLLGYDVIAWDAAGHLTSAHKWHHSFRFGRWKHSAENRSLFAKISDLQRLYKQIWTPKVFIRFLRKPVAMSSQMESILWS